MPRDRIDIGLDRPAIARIFDYLLGGAHHFAIDRAAAGTALAIDPTLAEATWAHRRFVLRAIRHVVAAGTRQILDLGCGHLGPGAVHTAAQRRDPSVRVLYVDRDPVVVEHACLVTVDAPDVGVLLADLRDIDPVLGAARQHLNFDEPVAVFLTAVLHQVDGDATGITQGWKRHLAGGSHLVVTHPVMMPPDSDRRIAALRQLHSAAGVPFRPRSQTEVADLMEGFALVGPGITAVDRWRSDPPPAGNRGASCPQIDLAAIGCLPRLGGR